MNQLLSARVVFSILMSFCLYVHAGAQALDFAWAKGIGAGADEIYPTSIAAGPAGSVYVTGYFFGTADFDPGPGAAPITAESPMMEYDIFVAKYDSIGNYVWAINIPCDWDEYDPGIAVDTAGNVYVTGNFQSMWYGTVDFDPGPGIAPLISEQNPGLFFAKYDANGNYVWAKALEYTGASANSYGRAIAVDVVGNIYITGNFFGNVDFNPGPGSAIISVNGTHAFLAKYTSGGDYIWAGNIGGSSFSMWGNMGRAIAVDANGQVYLTGYFSGTVDFDFGTGTASLSAGMKDAFIAKYDTNGGYLWAIRMEDGLPANHDEGRGIALDAAGNVYVTGHFQGTKDFDPGTGTALLTSAGATDVFVAKYSSSGGYLWAFNIGGDLSSSTGCEDTYDEGRGISVDASGDVYVTGTFSGTNVDFDPGSGTALLSSAGSCTDVFVARYDGNGNYLWAGQVEGTGRTISNGIAIDDLGGIYTTGTFYGDKADLNPGPDTAILYHPDGNWFLFKLQQPQPCDTVITFTVPACDSFIFNGVTYTQSGIYTDTFTTSAGCDSIVILALTINTVEASIARTETGLTAGNADSYQWLNCDDQNIISGATGQSYVPAQSGSYAVIVTQNGCTDTSDCQSITIDNNGIRNQGFTEQVSIYPNPAADMVHITSSIPVHITLTGIEGKTILQQRNANTLSLQGIVPGTYMMRITDKEGKLLKVERLLKQ